MQDLFRPEAVEHYGRRLYGEIILATSLRSWVLTGIFMLLLVLAALALAFGSFPRKETVSGQIVAAQGLAKAVAPDGSVIRTVHVRPGDRVARGDLLVTLQPALRLDDGAPVGELRLGELQAEEAAIQAQLQSLSARVAASLALLREEAQDLAARADGLMRLMKVEKERIALADEIIATAEPLLKDGYITRLELQERRQARLASLSRLEQLRLQAAEAAASQRKISHREQSLSASHTQERAALSLSLAALRGRIIDVRAQAAPAVTAAVAGTVVAVQATPGERARGHVALVTILPETGGLMAELYVPTSAAGFITAGQEVRLLMDAFPYQKFGPVNGVVDGVSEVAIEGDELRSSARDNAFLVRVRPLADSILDDAEDRHALRPGMTLTADLILEDRAAWEALFAPFLRSLRR